MFFSQHLPPPKQITIIIIIIAYFCVPDRIIRTYCRRSVCMNCITSIDSEMLHVAQQKNHLEFIYRKSSVTVWVNYRRWIEDEKLCIFLSFVSQSVFVAGLLGELRYAQNTQPKYTIEGILHALQLNDWRWQLCQSSAQNTRWWLNADRHINILHLLFACFC